MANEAQSPCVLVVDDDPRIREFIGAVLREAGFAVSLSDGGTKALSFVKMLPAVALVITDILMPEGDGITLIRALRGLTPRPKILAVSGGGMLPPSEYLENAGLLGADAVIAKPFTGQTIVARVCEMLELTPPEAGGTLHATGAIKP